MVISLLKSSDQRMEKKNVRWHNSALGIIKCYGLCPIYSAPALNTFDEDSHYAAQPVRHFIGELLKTIPRIEIPTALN